MSAYQGEAWSDFSVAVAGAGAALAGLLFVALSINLERILAEPRLPARAAHTLILLSVPLLVALLLLVPGQSEMALGWELLVAGVAVGVVLAGLNPPRHRPPHQPLVGWIVGAALPAVLLSVCTAVAGVGVMTGSLGGLYWIPVAVIASFIGALLNAWVLMVEILR